MSVDPRQVRDSLVEDVVKPARDAGRDVNVQNAEKYVVDILDGMERKQSEKKAGPVATESKNEVGEEFRRRTGRELDENWKQDKAAIAKAQLAQDSQMRRMVGEQRLIERLRWMRARPDLRAKVESLSLALNSSNQNIRKRAEMRMVKLIEKSNKLAGFDWRQPKPGKLFFG